MEGQLRVAPSGPYDLLLSSRLYSLPSAPAIARVTGDSYWFSADVAPSGKTAFLCQQGEDGTICVASSQAVLSDCAVRMVRHVLALDDDTTGVHCAMAGVPELASIGARLRGLRLMRSATVFQALVTGIIHQQVSLPAAQAALVRLVSVAGGSVEAGTIPLAVFPRAEAILELGPVRLQACGLSGAKVAAVMACAEMAAERRLEFEELRLLSTASLLGRFTGIRGVGEWTARWALEHGLGRPQLSRGDLALRSVVADLLGDDDPERGLRRRLGPYAEQAAFLLIASYVLRRYHGWSLDGAPKEAGYRN